MDILSPCAFTGLWALLFYQFYQGASSNKMENEDLRAYEHQFRDCPNALNPISLKWGLFRPRRVEFVYYFQIGFTSAGSIVALGSLLGSKFPSGALLRDCF